MNRKRERDKIQRKLDQREERETKKCIRITNKLTKEIGKMKEKAYKQKVRERERIQFG